MFQNGFSSGIQMPTWKNELSTVVSKFLAGLGKYSEHCSVSLESMEIKKKKMWMGQLVNSLPSLKFM